MSPPTWLTRDYLERVLSKYYNDAKLRVIEHNLRSALGKGENYGATLTRIQVKYVGSKREAPQERFLIAKTMIEDEDEFTREKKSGYDVYNREMKIYQDILPKLHALLREVADDEQLFPETLHVDELNVAIIFEDLNARGYKMADRLKRLDLAHVELILRKLAKMHATSAVLNARDEGCLEGYDRGFFNRHTDGFRTYFLGCLTACARWLDTQDEYKKYAAKLFALAPAYMAIGQRCFEPTPGHINVLTHGDLWTNNVMFKYDESTGQPVDVLLFDFQYAFWGSPTLDLHHLFNTSMVDEVRFGRQNELFKYFHGIFVATLRKLNFSKLPLPSLHEFHVQVEQKRFFAVHCALDLQAVLLNEDSTDADFRAFLSEDERGINFKNRLYTNPKVQCSIKTILPMFDCLGLLDADQ